MNLLKANDEENALENNLFEDRSKFKYMVFLLGGEAYGVPLLQVREVIENRPAKPVPNSLSAFEGVINLRGDVIGILDLRRVLGIEPKQSLSILVFDTEQGVMGAIVDRCTMVTEIPDKDVDRKSNVGHDGLGYFLGIGKKDGALITLLDLQRVAASFGNKAAIVEKS